MILVTGASGFVGSRLVLEMQYVGIEALALSPSINGYNLSKDKGWENLPNSCEGIIHLAQPPIAEIDESFDVNVKGTFRLVEYAQRAQAKFFVLASTGSVYPHSAEAINEASDTVYNDINSVTKLLSEVVLNTSEFQGEKVVLRLFTPYGPGQKGRLIPSIISKVRC